MDKQTMFDTAYRGVISQGKPSRLRDGSDRCMYRGTGGTKCGVGWLIDDETAKWWDGIGLKGGPSGIESVPLPGHLLWMEEHIQFLCDLQWAHDVSFDGGNHTFLRQFKEYMGQVAGRYGLKIPEVEHA